jgi:cytolysin-activating lysine-acyltransferase
MISLSAVARSALSRTPRFIRKGNVMFFKSSKSETEPKPEVKAVAKAPAKEEEAPTKPSPEQIAEVQRRAAKSKQLQASFGGIVVLLMRNPEFRNCTLADLEHLVLPALSNGQFTIAEAQEKKSGLMTPVAAILWASVSEEVDQRLSKTQDQPLKLAPNEWKSGDIPWLIAAVGDPRLIKALQQRLQESVLKDRPLKSRSTDTDDKPVVPTSQLH